MTKEYYEIFEVAADADGLKLKAYDFGFSPKSKNAALGKIAKAPEAAVAAASAGTPTTLPAVAKGTPVAKGAPAAKGAKPAAPATGASKAKK